MKLVEVLLLYTDPGSPPTHERERYSNDTIYIEGVYGDEYLNSTSLKKPSKYIHGQFFTPSEVADLIIAITSIEKTSPILDPSFGEGVFIKRIISKLVSSGLSKEQVLKPLLIGIEKDTELFEDFSKYIDRQKIKSDSQFNLDIIYSDYFECRREQKTDIVQTQLFEDKAETDQSLCPTYYLPELSSIIGNPPYTRHEDISLGESKREKTIIKKVISTEYPEIKIPNSMGLHGFFLLHSIHLLKPNGGLLGFVLPRSWMDTKYGDILKKIISARCLIRYIITSDEKWFKDAQMLPCILIIETEPRENIRQNNVTSFVHLKTPLKNILSIPDDDSQIYWNKLDEFVSSISESIHSSDETLYLGIRLHSFEDSQKRIISTKQKFIETDGKWSKYLSFPSVLFHLMSKCEDFLIPLGNVATIRRGITTGANNFFLFPNQDFEIEVYEDLIQLSGTDMDFKIPKKYFRPAVRSIRDQKTIDVDTTQSYILSAPPNEDLSFTQNNNLAAYIAYGENKEIQTKRGLKRTQNGVRGYHTLQTTRTRKPWFSLPIQKPPSLIVPGIGYSRHIVLHNGLNAIPTNAFFEIHPNDEIDPLLLCCILNSTISALSFEMMSRYVENQDTTVSSQIMGYQLSNIPIIEPARLVDYKTVLLNHFQESMGIPVSTVIERADNDFMLKEDMIILSDALKFNHEEIYSLRSNLAQVVKSRTSRRLRNND